MSTMPVYNHTCSVTVVVTVLVLYVAYSSGFPFTYVTGIYIHAGSNSKLIKLEVKQD